MKRYLVFLLGGLCLAQIPVIRPSPTAFTSSVTKQVQLATLTSAGYSYKPKQGAVLGGNVYIGDGNGTPWVLSFGTILGSVTITLQDSGGFQYGPAWVFTTSAANSTQPLVYLNGVWLNQGFKLSCTDSSSGTACALVSGFLVWRE